MGEGRGERRSLRGSGAIGKVCEGQRGGSEEPATDSLTLGPLDSGSLRKGCYPE